MARDRLYELNEGTWVGRYVYERYKPNKFGKIMTIIVPTWTWSPRGIVKRLVRRFKSVRVLWEDSTEADVRIDCLNDAQDLIDEHARKLKRHQDRLERAKQKVDNIATKQKGASL